MKIHGGLTWCCAGCSSNRRSVASSISSQRIGKSLPFLIFPIPPLCNP